MLNSSMPAHHHKQQQKVCRHEQRHRITELPVVRTLILSLSVLCAVWIALSAIAAAPDSGHNNQAVIRQQQEQQIAFNSSSRSDIHAAAAATPPPHQQSKQQQQQQEGTQSSTTAVRFFIDEGYFLEGDTEILRAYVAASQGRMQISGESSAAFLSVKGYYVPDKWDVYVTIRQACHMAFKYMTAGKFVNCLPGVQAMSLKRDFVLTWQQAYGEAAFSSIPRSYLIPEQYWLWRSHLKAAGSPNNAKWVLKANMHRGKGVSVVTQHEALSQALMHSSSSSSSGGTAEYHNILVQQYLEPQMVIGGRSSYLRVWLLVTSITPLRAYLFKGGFAIFGKQKSNSSSSSNNGTAAAAATNSSSSSDSDELIVNLWIQNREESPVWSLQQLEQYLNKHPEMVVPLPVPQQQQQHLIKKHSTGNRHLYSSSSNDNDDSNSSSSNMSQLSNTTAAAVGNVQQQQQRRTFADAWADMQVSTSLVLAAALPAMRAAAANASAPNQGMFEYFGLDFVLDAYLRPWLLEVNAIPSMARRKNGDCSGDKATANCQLSTAATGSSSSSTSSSGGGSTGSDTNTAVDDFDEQKEQFVHDMLVLLGLPVDAPAAAAAANNHTSSSSSDPAATTPDGAQLLRFSALAVAAAAANSQHTSDRNAATGNETSARQLSLLTAGRRRAARRLQQQPDSSAAAAHGGAQGLLERENSALSTEALPVDLQAMVCSSLTSSNSNSSSTGSGDTLGPFECITCLTADDLAALAMAEAELQRVGRFVPVYDLTAALETNRKAVAGMQERAADVGSSKAGDILAAAAAVPGATRDQDHSIGQQQQQRETKQVLAMEGLDPTNAAALENFFTTAHTLGVNEKLKLTRQDYVMSAWLRVRRQQQQQGDGPCCGGSGLSAACVLHLLKQLVSLSCQDDW